MALDQREQRLWGRVEDGAIATGTPSAVVSTLTPFPFWVLIGSMLVLPLALILSFFVKRQAIASFGGEIAVYELSFWRQRVEAERLRIPAGAGQASLEGNKLRIAGERFHIEPGWGESARRVLGDAG